MRWGPRIDEANQTALSRMLAVEPVWTDVVAARFAMPELGERDLLHAGPPFSHEEHPLWLAPSAAAAMVDEGWAQDLVAADELFRRGGARLVPSDAHDAVVFGSGVIGPQTMGAVVEDRRTGRRVFAPLFDNAVAASLRDELGPTLARVLHTTSALDLMEVFAEALQRGDDLRLRCQAAGDMLSVRLARRLLTAGIPRRDAELVLDWTQRDEQLARALAVASAKLILLASHGVEHSTLICGLGANGQKWGLQIASSPHQWFVSDAPVSSQTVSRMSGLIGDDVVSELAGWGASAMISAPSVVQKLETTLEHAIATFRSFRSLCVGTHPDLMIPLLRTSIGLGVDVRRVIESNASLTVIAPSRRERDLGGWTAESLVDLPSQPFADALQTFASDRGLE